MANTPFQFFVDTTRTDTGLHSTSNGGFEVVANHAIFAKLTQVGADTQVTASFDGTEVVFTRPGAVGAATFSGESDSSSASALSIPVNDELAARYFQYLVNQERASVGSQPLSNDAGIVATAAKWTQHLDANDTFEHDNAGTFYGQYVDAGTQMPSGPHYFSVGEIIGAGWTWHPELSGADKEAQQEQSYLNDLFSQYLGSSTHKAEIDNPFNDRMGASTDFDSYHVNGDSAVNTTRFLGTESTNPATDTHEVTGIVFHDWNLDDSFDFGEQQSDGKVVITNQATHESKVFELDGGGGFDWHNVSQGDYTAVAFDDRGAHTDPLAFHVGDQNVDLTHLLSYSVFDGSGLLV